MHIEELNSTNNNRNITIRLDYKELRDMANGLFYACKNEEHGDEYKAIYAKVSMLFDLVKHGDIMHETVVKMYETDEEIIRKLKEESNKS